MFAFLGDSLASPDKYSSPTDGLLRVFLSQTSSPIRQRSQMQSVGSLVIYKVRIIL